MGKEARCTCRWGAREGSVVALLEPRELIVRGAIRTRIPLTAIEQVRVEGSSLAFAVGGEKVELALGDALARRWATAIVTPPPTLARKLGVDPRTRLHVSGTVDDDALAAALAEAATAGAEFAFADIAIIRADDLAPLERWVERILPDAPIPPTWVIYQKGRGAPLGEDAVRTFMRAHGFIDTKVAAVSDRLGALRFIRAKPQPAHAPDSRRRAAPRR